MYTSVGRWENTWSVPSLSARSWKGCESKINGEKLEECENARERRDEKRRYVQRLILHKIFWYHDLSTFSSSFTLILSVNLPFNFPFFSSLVVCQTFFSQMMIIRSLLLFFFHYVATRFAFRVRCLQRVLFVIFQPFNRKDIFPFSFHLCRLFYGRFIL